VLVPELVASYDWDSYRGVIFIDPFHANLSRTILEKVASTHALDVWFLFPLFAIGRMLVVEGDRISEPWIRKLDNFFGTHEWYGNLYSEQVQQPSLFDCNQMGPTRDRGYEELLGFTEEWLKGIFGRSNVLRPLVLRSSNNSPLFALFAAISSNSKSAIELWRRIAKYILDRAEQS